MKREDFKEIKEGYFESCKKIINKNGLCIGIDCFICPFDVSNSLDNNGCMERNYSEKTVRNKTDEELIKSCKEFLKFQEREVKDKESDKIGSGIIHIWNNLNTSTSFVKKSEEEDRIEVLIGERDKFEELYLNSCDEIRRLCEVESEEVKQKLELKEKLDISELKYYKEREEHNGTKKALDMFRGLSENQINITDDKDKTIKRYKGIYEETEKELDECKEKLIKSEANVILLNSVNEEMHKKKEWYESVISKLVSK